MSTMPSHQLRTIDKSHHKTSYGGYTNRGQHASGGAIINNFNHPTTNHQYAPSNPLEELEKHCSPNAAFDSAARFDPPRCAESTRLRITQIIEEWVNSEGRSGLFWLHGGAGVGKSALAQSLSEKFQEKELLAASFFFFRSDPSRNNGSCLIPTLASHLVDSFEGIIPFVEDRVRRNRALFTKKYQIQIRELLVEPLVSLRSKSALGTHPRLIVIDGLDECQNPDAQCELLRVIARAISRIPYPLRFLVTSRPEAHITDTFNHDRDLQAVAVHRYNLSSDPDADMDIRKFLEKEFLDLRRIHRLGPHLPFPWPDPNAITSLIERSSGHFIYASTVLRYIRCPKHRPDDRLDVILRLRPPREGDRPYAQLDALYALIFDGVEDHDQLEKICLVLGILYCQSEGVASFAPYTRYTSIEELLQRKAGDLVLLLDPILSLVSINGDYVRILHKSLFDYLLDFTRGGHLPFNLARVHELAASYILKEKIVKDVCKMDDFQDFAYHCQYAYLNDILKDYLFSLEAPYPKSIIPTFPSWGFDMHGFRRNLIWYFFRILSREDFDSTGQVYEQYIANCTRYLRSTVPRRSHRRSSTAHGVAKLNSLQCELDTLFREWKPHNLKPMDFLRMDPVTRVACIKQEHNVFSAYAQVFGNTDATSSSLVFGNDFIHSYHFGIRAKDSFLIVQTYSRHGKTCYQSMHDRCLDIAQEALNYLKRLEKYLFSELYQKYGLDPEKDRKSALMISRVGRRMRRKSSRMA